MGLYAWCARRSGGLAMIALLALSYWVIYRGASDSPDQAGYLTVAFAYYCLFIHLLVFIFPFRACWAVCDITRSLSSAVLDKSLRLKLSDPRRDSYTSLSSAETLAVPSSRYGSISPALSLSSSSSESGDDDESKKEHKVVHAIAIPNYKEEMDTLRETLEVLACHPQSRHCYDVYLAMEERETGAEEKAASLISEFSNKFRNIRCTMHPPDIPGESAGKGSNLGWAARKLSEEYPLAMRRNVIVTGIDADSHLSVSYFDHLTAMHLSYIDTAHTTLYAAPIIFDRNAHNVPALVRVADILWSAAGMSGLYHGSTIGPPTSVYSVPLELVDRVGGWDCGPEAIGEDLHMYLKCFFALNGNLTVRTVLSPVSQCNVTGGSSKGLRGVYSDGQARYKQAQRHMWGALDTGYALKKIIKVWKEQKHTSRAFRPLHQSMNGDHIYVPHEASPDNSVFADVEHREVKGINYSRTFYLFHRLFEAHFLPVHMTIMVIASAILLWFTSGKPDTLGIAWIFDVCNVLRTIGFMGAVFYMYFYESFHRICLAVRQEEMAAAGLLEGMRFSSRSLRKNLVDYIMAPVAAPVYGSIPCAQAQICHFWTVDLVYTVSKKVTRHRGKALDRAEVMA